MLQGTAGLAMAAVGALGTVVTQGGIQRALRTVGGESDVQVGALHRSLWVIAGAVLVYLGLRYVGSGRIGLYMCIAILVANATTVAAARVRWLDALRPPPPPEVCRAHRFWSWAQALSVSVGFVGCAVYLLRP